VKTAYNGAIFDVNRSRDRANAQADATVHVHVRGHERKAVQVQIHAKNGRRIEQKQVLFLAGDRFSRRRTPARPTIPSGPGFYSM
jgi:hypothetical protein